MRKTAQARYQTFALAIFTGQRGTTAARTAGYRGSSLKVTASKLLRKPEVKAELLRLRAGSEFQATVTRQEVLEVLTATIQASMADYLDGNGSLDLAQAKRNGALRVLRTLKVRKHGFAIELRDRLRAIDILARMMGWYS